MLSRHKRLRFRPHVLPAFHCTMMMTFEDEDDFWDDFVDDFEVEDDDEVDFEDAFQTFGNASMTSNVTTTVGH